MNLVKLYWDKLLLLTMLLFLATAVGMEFLSFQKTKSAVEADDRQGIVKMKGKKNVVVIDATQFDIMKPDKGDFFHIAQHKPYEGTLYTPATYIYSSSYFKSDQHRYILHFTTTMNPYTGEPENQGSGRVIIGPEEPTTGNKKDTDGDTIPDHIEDKVGMDKHNRRDADWDKDGDLFSNIEEFRKFPVDYMAINDPRKHPLLIRHVRLFKKRQGKLGFKLKNVDRNVVDDKKTWTAQVDILGKRGWITRFIKIGGQLRKSGFVIIDLTFEMRKVKVSGTTIPEKYFTATIQRGDDPPIIMLPRKQPLMPNPTYSLINLHSFPFKRIANLKQGSEIRLTDTKNQKELYEVIEVKSRALVVARIGGHSDEKIQVVKVTATEHKARKRWLQAVKSTERITPRPKKGSSPTIRSNIGPRPDGMPRPSGIPRYAPPQ